MILLTTSRRQMGNGLEDHERAQRSYSWLSTIQRHHRSVYTLFFLSCWVVHVRRHRVILPFLAVIELGRRKGQPGLWRSGVTCIGRLSSWGLEDGCGSFACGKREEAILNPRHSIQQGALTIKLVFATSRIYRLTLCRCHSPLQNNLHGHTLSNRNRPHLRQRPMPSHILGPQIPHLLIQMLEQNLPPRIHLLFQHPQLKLTLPRLAPPQIICKHIHPFMNCLVLPEQLTVFSPFPFRL